MGKIKLTKNNINKALILLVLLKFCALALLNPTFAAEDTIAGIEGDVLVTITKYASMATAVSLSCIAAGMALSRTGAASVASVTEKPELFGRTMVYVGMAEGIAIYGLLIAFLIWVD